jgi:predicted SAM-dependent methyltransferase
MSPLPFWPASVEWVYAEHMIKHVSLPAGLAAIKKVLKPGGLLRLTTPDLANL